MRTIEININKSELLREVEQWSYTLGENLGDDAAKRRHFVQGALDRGHVTLIESRLDEAWSTLLGKLAAYTVERCAACGTEDGERFPDTDGPNDYGVTLSFPDNTFPNLDGTINSLCRRYLSLQARAEWERLTHQDENNCVSEAQSEQTLRKLKVAISARTTNRRLKSYYGWG